MRLTSPTFTRLALASLCGLAACGRIGFSGQAGGDASDTEDARPGVDAAIDSSPGCPVGRGPAMTLVAGVCIDNTEVTKAQYTEFVAAGLPVNVSGRCGFNTEYAAEPSVFNATSDSKPIGGVDWCDARDYCTWAGKRLCGTIVGGPVPYAAPPGERFPVTAQWTAACSSGGVNAYPYGDTYQAGACYFNGPNELDMHAVAGTYPDCAIVGTTVFDLIGNVSEWVDACETAGGLPEDDRCMVPSGAWFYGDADMSYATCDWPDPDTTFSLRRDARAKNIGFRCCADPTMEPPDDPS